MKEQSYNSTPPMGRTACTEPQCLYKGALYIYFSFTFCTSFSKRNEKGEGQFVLARYNTSRHRGTAEVQRHAILMSALVGSGWPASRPGRCILGDELRYPRSRRFGGLRNLFGEERDILSQQRSSGPQHLPAGRQRFCPQAVLPASHSVRKPFFPQTVLSASRSVRKPFCPLAFLSASSSVRQSFSPQAVLYASRSVRKLFYPQAVLSSSCSVHKLFCPQAVLSASLSVRKPF